MPTISIIVPIYNVEPFLPNSIISILEQTYKDFELLLVNDGSTDNSGKICDKFAEKDNRIKVIHKDNEGVSSARNKGIEIASGDYVAFVDPDDTVEPNMYEFLLESALTYKADITICPIKTIDHVNNTVSNSLIWEKANVPINKASIEKYLIPSLLTERTYSLVSSVNKLYKKSLFDNLDIRFDEKKTHSEDARLNYTLLTLIDSLVFIEQPLYNYHIYKRESLTQIFREDLHEYALDNKRFLLGLCRNYKLEKYKDVVTNHFTRIILGHMQDVVNRQIPKGKKYKILSNILGNKEFKEDLSIYKSENMYYTLLKKLCLNENKKLFFILVKNKSRIKKILKKNV